MRLTWDYLKHAQCSSPYSLSSPLIRNSDNSSLLQKLLYSLGRYLFINNLLDLLNQATIYFFVPLFYFNFLIYNLTIEANLLKFRKINWQSLNSKLSTELRMALALLTSGRRCGNSPPVHQPLMCSQSPEKPWLRLNVSCVPNPLRKRTRPYPNLHVMSVPVVYLTPQTHLSPQHICLVIIIGNVSGHVLVVQV